MLLRIYWIKQIAFLYTSQATISALKNDVNLLRAMLHCIRAFTFVKTISTSTTKYKCRCELGKTKHYYYSPTQILQHFKVFRLSFSETIPIFFIRLKKWFYPYLIAMKFSPLTDFGLNSRDKSFNKKSSKWLKLILSSVKVLLNIIFRCLEILVYFLSCDPENQDLTTCLSATSF